MLKVEGKRGELTEIDNLVMGTDRRFEGALSVARSVAPLHANQLHSLSVGGLLRVGGNLHVKDLEAGHIDVKGHATIEGFVDASTRSIDVGGNLNAGNVYASMAVKVEGALTASSVHTPTLRAGKLRLLAPKPGHTSDLEVKELIVSGFELVFFEKPAPVTVSRIEGLKGGIRFELAR